jgi:hypothetical protein
MTPIMPLQSLAEAMARDKDKTDDSVAETDHLLYVGKFPPARAAYLSWHT